MFTRIIQFAVPVIRTVLVVICVFDDGPNDVESAENDKGNAEAQKGTAEAA